MNAVLLLEGGNGSRRVEVRTRQEAAELIGTTLDDLTCLPFGPKQAMYMSKSAQLERGRAPNHSATLVLERVAGMPVPVRGDVLSFPHGEPWRKLSG